MKNILLILMLILGGCDEHEYPNVSKKIEQSGDTEYPQQSRFDLEKVARFHDLSAYGCCRDIYLLTDKNTGKEYIGISGIGISELGSYGAGKSHTADER